MLLLTLSLNASATTLAITEFLNDTLGDESLLEWVELYNYGNQPVDLNGWTLADEDTDNELLPAAMIPPGGFVILSEDPQSFIGNWGVGTVGVNVLLLGGGALGEHLGRARPDRSRGPRSAGPSPTRTTTARASPPGWWRTPS